MYNLHCLLTALKKLKISLPSLTSGSQSIFRKKPQIALVTCMYNGLSGTKYGGRLNRDSFYRDSLLTIATNGLPVYCFVSKSEFDKIKSTHLGTMPNIKWIFLEISDIPFSSDIQSIKATFPEAYTGFEWQQRCVEIMWGKFYMLRRILQEHPKIDCAYWIDAGLAHAGIISPKYTSDEALNAGRRHDFISAFPSILFTRITKFVDGRILGIKTTIPHQRVIPEKFNNNPYKNSNSLIGGLFGGLRNPVLKLCDLFDQKCIQILHNNQLYFEESILTAMYADHPELFKSFTFDSWYHEGWTDFYNPKQINFSQFFDQMLQNPKPGYSLNCPGNNSATESTLNYPKNKKEKDMKTDQNVFDITLHNMGLSDKPPFFLVIGAMDGVSFDDFNPYLKAYKWSGLFVEPIPEQFRRLKLNVQVF